MKTVFSINNYREACKFLQDKYDNLGYIRLDYYHTTGSDNHLTKTGKTGRGNVGLQYHHICEDLVANLSIVEVAAQNPIEYQAAANMCYCNLLEHLYLHILIAEQQKENEDNGAMLGDGGVNWLVLALNSIYANPAGSWYSKKGEALSKLTPEQFEELQEVSGMTYNYNNIITDNYDTYLKLINKYCTSAFIRMKEDLTPSEIAAKLCIACKKDQGVQKIYNDILHTAKDTFLFEHNTAAFVDLETYLHSNKTALVKICTGGGKTTTALEYLRVHDCKALALGPGNTIEDSWLRKDSEGRVFSFNLDHVEYMNYQSFMTNYKMINWSKYQVLVCDEAHHIQAEKWGEGIRWAIDNIDIKVIGLTATPNEQQTNGADPEFAGRLCYGLDLATGIREQLIYPFGYIQSIYKMESVKDEFYSYGPTGKLLWDKLNIKASEEPIEKILKDNMPNGPRKIVVFVQQIKDKDDVMSALRRYNSKFESEDYMRFICSADADYAASAKEWFENTNDHDVCLVSRDMVNEGAHYSNVNTLIMFRNTKSNRLFLQQLGRIVVTVNGHMNPNGMVFDFTNNAQTLIHRNKSVINFTRLEEVPADDSATEAPAAEIPVGDDEVKEITEALKDSPVVYKDYTEDCISILTSLQDSRNANAHRSRVYGAFMNELFSISIPSELFDLELWKDAKTTAGDEKLTISRRTGGYSGSGSHSSGNSRPKSTVLQRGEVKASDAEKVVMALTCLIKRAYNFGIISFADDAGCTMTVTDKAAFTNILQALGFRDADCIERVIKNLKQYAYVLASDIDNK